MEAPFREPAARDAGVPVRTRGCARLYLAVLAASLALFGATTQRGPAWQDSGVLQLRIHRFDLEGESGLALAHPLAVVLGKGFSLLPWGPLAWRMNLLSAACAAVAAANVAALVRRLVPRPLAAAWLAAGFFAFAHTVWWLATICESQCLLAALLTTELHLLVSLIDRPRAWKAGLLAAVNGLAATAHNLALLSLPAYGAAVIVLCLRRRLRWWSPALFAGGWALGAGLLLVLVARQAAEAGAAAAVRSALFGANWQPQVLGFSTRAVGRGIACVLYSFPNAALPLAALGVWRLGKRSPRALLVWAVGYLAAIHFAFAVRYAVPDQFMFFVPFYVMVSVLTGVGFARLCEGRRRWLAVAAAVSLAAGPGLYAAAPSLARRLSWPPLGREDLPFRDAPAYWLTPWKAAERSAGHFAERALQEVETGGTIIADGTSYPPLAWGRQVRGKGRGVRVLRGNRATPAAVPPGTPNVWVVSDVPGYYPKWLNTRADLSPVPGRILLRVDWHTGEK